MSSEFGGVVVPELSLEAVDSVAWSLSEFAGVVCEGVSLVVVWAALIDSPSVSPPEPSGSSPDVGVPGGCAGGVTGVTGAGFVAGSLASVSDVAALVVVLVVVSDDSVSEDSPQSVVQLVFALSHPATRRETQPNTRMDRGRRMTQL